VRRAAELKTLYIMCGDRGREHSGDSTRYLIMVATKTARTSARAPGK